MIANVALGMNVACSIWVCCGELHSAKHRAYGAFASILATFYCLYDAIFLL